MKAKFRNVIRIIDNWDMMFLGVLIASLVVLTLFLVVMRYAIGRPVAWGEEIQLALFMWVIFLGSAVAFRKGQHITVELIVDQLPLRLRRIAELVISIIVLALLFYLMLQGFDYIKLLVDSNRVTAQLRIPYAYIYGIMPVSCFLMIINLIYGTIINFKLSAHSPNKEVDTIDI